MQRDLGLTSAQLSQYLKIERLAELQQKRLATAQGRNFAGSWIERGADGTFKLVVATTRTGAQKGPVGVEFRTARLEQIERLNAVGGAARGMSEAGDYIENDRADFGVVLGD